MRALQKLVANGNSTQVTLQRNLLAWLGWLPGELVIVEVTENKHVIVRKPNPNDIATPRARPIILEPSFPEAPK